VRLLKGKDAGPADAGLPPAARRRLLARSTKESTIARSFHTVTGCGGPAIGLRYGDRDGRVRRPAFMQITGGYAEVMGPILVLLLIALILAGVGFAVHVLWIVAVVFLIAWLVGLVLGVGRRSNAG
jgi:hypothetical protein